jgi:putative spermidine/putrescine transport system substrate-binding protein
MTDPAQGALAQGGRITRRGAMLAGAAALALPAFIQPARAASPALSGRPVTLGIIDVAGNLALTQKVFDNYAGAHADRVGRFAISRAPAPELASKIRAMQRANRLDVDIVLTGTDGLSAGLELDLWEDISRFADPALSPDTLYDTGARKLADLARGFGALIAYTPQGPFLQYAPTRVSAPPTTLQGLLDWARAHPNRMIYPRPANSGPGRTFMMGLPYILGDSDPKDPDKGWEKSWAYLAELGKYIEYYPSGTAAMLREFGQGGRDIVVSTMGWDINPRFLSVIPRDSEISILEGFHFVADGHYAAVPKGLPQDRLAAALDVLRFMLQPEQQAVTYDDGYFFPGPARKGVTLAMAPESSQQVIRDFGRPMFDKLMAETPIEAPLDPKPLVAAFRRWDEQIGAKKTSP